MNFFRKALKKIKLFVLFWTRIVFVKNNFKVNFFIKLKCNFGRGFLADQYVLYDLKNNNKEDFLSEFDWYRSRYINEPFDFAFNNKVVCAEILKQHMRVADNYFIKNKGIIYDFEHGKRCAEDILELLTKKKKLIIKPFALGKGNGVHLFSFDNNDIFVDDSRIDKIDFLKLLNSQKEYIICEYIRQHRYADELYDKTANTIRLITMRDTKSHEMKIFFAVQRMGTSSTIPVDNGSKGGLVSMIDLETGVLSSAKCLRSTETYEEHPDSGKKIAGTVIPGWEDVKKEILDATKRLPFMDFIAWDLLITEDGVCVIEANSSSGVNIIQLFGGQRNGELGDFFRHYGVIK